MDVDVEVTYAYPATADERGQVEAWVAQTDCHLISAIWVSPYAVIMDAVEGPFRFRTGSAARRGRLIDELTEAHLTLSRAVRWHVSRSRGQPSK